MDFVSIRLSFCACFRAGSSIAPDLTSDCASSTAGAPGGAVSSGSGGAADAGTVRSPIVLGGDADCSDDEVSDVREEGEQLLHAISRCAHAGPGRVNSE